MARDAHLELDADGNPYAVPDSSRAKALFEGLQRAINTRASSATDPFTPLDVDGRLGQATVRALLWALTGIIRDQTAARRLCGFGRTCLSRASEGYNEISRRDPEAQVTWIVSEVKFLTTTLVEYTGRGQKNHARTIIFLSAIVLVGAVATWHYRRR